MGALVAVDQGFRLQRNAMDFNQLIHRVKDKINFKRLAYFIGQQLFGVGIQNRYHVGTLAGAIRQVSNICQQDFPWAVLSELPL